ncbi:MAG: fimbrial protein [Rhizobiaceae bacterium]|nr:fimbrial protein [Rhizobiaceae bacterium]
MGAEYEDEPPLDPVLENVRRKLVRRMAWSLGIMMIGLMAVLGAIVYKISTPQQASDILSAEEGLVIDIPDGADVVSSSLDEDFLLITIRLADGGYQLLSVDRKTGETRSQLELQ